MACPSRGASQKLGVLLLLPSVVSQQAVQRRALFQLERVEGAVLTERRNQRREGTRQQRISILLEWRVNGVPCVANSKAHESASSYGLPNRKRPATVHHIPYCATTTGVYCERRSTNVILPARVAQQKKAISGGRAFAPVRSNDSRVCSNK